MGLYSGAAAADGAGAAATTADVVGAAACKCGGTRANSGSSVISGSISGTDGCGAITGGAMAIGIAARGGGFSLRIRWRVSFALVCRKVQSASSSSLRCPSSSDGGKKSCSK